MAVDLRLGGIVVGAHVEDAEDAQGKDIQKVPAQVAQLEDKDPPFVPIGHAETQLEGSSPGEVGVLRQNVGHSEVPNAPDDPWDDEQKGPQRGEQRTQKL